MKLFIKGHKAGSKSVKALRDVLKAADVDVKLIRNKNSKYVHDAEEHLVINWGDSGAEVYGNMLNDPRAISFASDKMATFKSLAERDVSSVPFFFTKEGAQDFLEAREGRVVYCRTIIQGSQGDGIVVAKNADELVPAKLYTGGIVDKKRKEYRVHVFNGKVINIQEKRRRNGYKELENYSDDVRNLAGGWVFCTKDVKLGDETVQTCVNAVAALGLDFGAVDILQTTNGKCWVLEVNTACGLQGSTVDKYVEAIKDYLNPKVADVADLVWGED